MASMGCDDQFHAIATDRIVPIAELNNTMAQKFMYSYLA
jgi:hypothetical protein